MLESTDIGDGIDVLPDVIGTPSELNSNASKHSFPVNNNKVVAIIDQMD